RVRVAISAVARALGFFRSGSRVAPAPERQVVRGFVRAGDPYRAAAVLPRLGIAEAAGARRARLPRIASGFARRWNRVEPPRFPAGARVIRGDEAANPVLASAHADDDLVLHDERRVRHRVA